MPTDIDENINSIQTDNAIRVFQGNVTQVAPSGDQIWNYCKWRHLVAKFWTDASGAIW